ALPPSFKRPPWFAKRALSTGRRLKLMDGNRVILLAPSKHRGRERRMVGRIGKVLRLQTKPVALLIDFAVLSDERAVQKISCVELNSRLSRPDLHRAS